MLSRLFLRPPHFTKPGHLRNEKNARKENAEINNILAVCSNFKEVKQIHCFLGTLILANQH